MSHVNVVRAWKDEAYRLSLTEAERAALPENPAGLLEQTEAELERAAGGLLFVHTVVDCYYILTDYTILTIPPQSIACTTNGVLTTSVQTINQYGGLRG
jgi:mersacidin/lichenicidin family type 2 lantibiotic